MTALNIAQPFFLQQKTTQLHKQKHPSQALFPPRTYFMPHTNVAKTDFVVESLELSLQVVIYHQLTIKYH